MAENRGQQKHVRISPEAEKILVELQNEKGFRSLSSTLEYMILDYENNRNIADAVATKVTDALSKVLTRIRLGTNTADINSQITIELLNSIIYQFGVKPMTTDFEETPAVSVCRSHVKGKIADMKQKKDSKARGE